MTALQLFVVMGAALLAGELVWDAFGADWWHELFGGDR